MNKFIIGLFTVSAIAFGSTGANAQTGDSNNAQIIHQTNITHGNHNVSVNRANQIHQNFAGDVGSYGSNASGQVIHQICQTQGISNVCINSAYQQNKKMNQGIHPPKYQPKIYPQKRHH
jgi:hypothetical protein